LRAIGCRNIMLAIAGVDNPALPVQSQVIDMRAIGCRNIMLAIAGVDNPALPVQSQVIDKFIFRDTWFDVSYHLPYQLRS